MHKAQAFYLHLFSPIIYCLLFVFSFSSWWLFGQFVVGVFIGFSLSFIDRWIQAFFLQPETEFHQIIHHEWKQHHYMRVFSLLAQAGTLQTELTTRSLLFIGMFVVMAVFVLTSTGSSLGVGLVLGAVLHYCLDIWLYHFDQAVFHQQFLWQLKRNFSERELQWYVGLAWLAFAAMSVVVLWQR